MKRSFNIYDTKDTFVLLCVCMYCSVSNIFCIISVALPPLIRGGRFGGERIQRRPPVRAYVVTNRWSKALYLVVCRCVCVFSLCVYAFRNKKSAAGAKCFLPCVLTCPRSPVFARPVSKVFVRIWSVSRVLFPVSKNCPLLVVRLSVCVSDWLKHVGLKLITVHWH